MQLKDFLEVQNVPLYEFAVKIGVSPDTVYSWCQGRKFPRHKNIHKIFEATKGAVSLHDWNDLRNNA
jgi:DNA-binding transcriptional regulator YdaS (Cro superfamily)